MRTLLRAVLKLVSWAVVLAALVLLGSTVAVLLGPRVAGWQPLVVPSGSMEPALNVGGLAFVQPLSNAEDVRVGDIITYRSPRDPKKQISHRVIEIVENEEGFTFRTKRDASELPDQALVPPGNVVGKVRFHVPYAGLALDKLRHRQSFYLFVGILAASIILTELSSIARAVRQEQRRRQAARQQNDALSGLSAGPRRYAWASVDSWPSMPSLPPGPVWRRAAVLAEQKEKV